MNESLRLVGKKALVIAVAGATILWTLGVSAFVAPLQADAASMGNLIKGPTLQTVYYYATDGSRYAFPNEKTYFTWYNDFSGVQNVSDSELAAIPLAGNVVYRPGSRFIKIQSDPKTYAVGPNGMIHWIETEDVAVGLAGNSWNQFVDDVPDVFFVDYTVGASLTNASQGYNGMLFQGSYYVIWNGQCREITDSGVTANRFQDRFFTDAPDVDCGSFPMGPPITGLDGEFSDPSQIGDVVTGGLNVSLASDTPASATIPAGAASVPFTKVKLHAQTGSATVNGMTWNLGGVGAVANIDSAYLYEGSTRLTDAKNVNTQTRNVTFGALNVPLGNNGMSYATLRADVAAAVNGGDTANFGLTGPGSISSTASVSGNFPIRGNTMSFSATQAGTLVVDKRGTVSDPTLGQKDATIAKFDVEAQNEDAWVYEITVNVDNAADHTNYKLWNGNELLAVGTVRGDLVTFILINPLMVDEGNKENLDVTADIGGDSGDDVKVAVEADADVLAVGHDFGFNMAVNRAGYNDDGAQCVDNGDNCSFSTIQGGDLTFAFNGPPSDDIQVDGDDENLMDFAITSENWTELQNVGMNLECLSGATNEGCLIDSVNNVANFDDISIRRTNGGVFMGPQELAVGGNDLLQSLDFNDTQVLNPGTTEDLMFTVDVANNQNANFIGDIFQASIDMDGSTTDGIEAEDINGDNLVGNSIVPASDLVGNQFTVQDATLDITASSPPSDSTWVKGAQNVDVVGFNYEAGDASGITLTDVRYSSIGEDDGAAYPADPVNDDNIAVRNFVNSCSLYDAETGGHIAGPEGFDNNDEVLFDDFTWGIPPGETKKQKMRCNFANVPPMNANDDSYAWFLEDVANNVTAEDDDGDNVQANLNEDNNDGAVTIITITANGDLNLTLDGSSPKSNIILGNSTGVLASVFKAEAIDESFLIKEVTIDNCSTTAADANGNCGDAGDEALGADDIAATVRLKYKDESGTEKQKSGFLSAGRATLAGLTWFVPNSNTRMLSAEVDTNMVSATSANSGDFLQLNLNAEDTGTATFEAVGSASGSTIREDVVDTYVVAKRMTARKTKPTLTLHAASPSGASTPSFQEALRLNVAADSRGFVNLNAFTMRVNATDGAGSGWNDCGTLDDPAKWEFYDVADPSEKLDDNNDWFFLDNVGADDVCTGTNNVAIAVLDLGADATTPVEEIGAGQTNTYVVKVDTSGASSTNDDSFRLDVLDNAEAAALTEDCSDGAGTDCTSFDANDSDDGVDTAGEIAALSWDDDVEANEVNGANVKNLPITGGTLVY